VVQTVSTPSAAPIASGVAADWKTTYTRGTPCYTTLHDQLRELETAFCRGFPTVWERISQTINGPTQVDGTQQVCSDFKGQEPPRDGLDRGGSPERGRTRWTGDKGDPLEIMTRVTVDLTIMIVGGAIFAIFWVKTTDMGPEATAQQIHNSGMQIPGFRQNVRSIERVLDQYIPQVTVIGGALVGVLAVGVTCSAPSGASLERGCC